ncbi:hypothetical protein AOLI_G00089580 [Acnodon oligacanthus]
MSSPGPEHPEAMNFSEDGRERAASVQGVECKLKLPSGHESDDGRRRMRKLLPEQAAMSADGKTEWLHNK